MCTVSMIIDNYRDTGRARDYYWPGPNLVPGVSRAEFDRLKEEFEELKELIKAAKKYDDNTGQPDCEMDDKVDFLRGVAEYLGVDVDDVFGEDK